VKAVGADTSTLTGMALSSPSSTLASTRRTPHLPA
jgi:hypothetical protein